jgi:hypothetical protein
MAYQKRGTNTLSAVDWKVADDSCVCPKIKEKSSRHGEEWGFGEIMVLPKATLLGQQLEKCYTEAPVVNSDAFWGYAWTAR